MGVSLISVHSCLSVVAPKITKPAVPSHVVFLVIIVEKNLAYFHIYTLL